MLLARLQIARAHLQNAARVNQEFHFDARQARRAGGNLQLKPRQRTAILRQFALALEDVKVNAGLIFDAGGEQFLRARGNRGIPRNDFRHHPAHRFDAQRERRHVQKQHVLHAGLEDVRLDRRTERHHFIGIELAVRRAPEIIADRLAHQRNPRGPADENDLIHLRGRELGIRKSQFHGRHGARDDWADQIFEFRARDFPRVRACGAKRIPDRNFRRSR